MSASAEPLRELITFDVEGQLFALDVQAIREIRAWTPVSRVPNAPSYMAGVVNLRGSVLPVISLAARLGWDSGPATVRHAIVIVEYAGRSHGLIVDGVRDIVTIDRTALQAPPPASDNGIESYIEGMVPIDDDMVMVLRPGALVAQTPEVEAA